MQNCDIVNLQLKKPQCNDVIDITATSYPVICTQLLPTVNVKWQHLKGLDLVDDWESSECAIDMLIGSNILLGYCDWRDKGSASHDLIGDDEGLTKIRRQFWETEPIGITNLRFDGSTFISNLEASVADWQKRGKPPRKIRYIHYCQWAHALLKKDIGPEEDDAQFGFPAQLLTFLRYITLGDVKGEIREDAFPVTMGCS
ncbi:Hypothetical predicted protein [Paramuricea clavata]|uniref:Uncharacterized protein n=1 Tax=Paramuricea clavata TaxID=317549 RepID=A0A7D9HTJ0_PARCT|nr:Hypothetical predicted protein [Paramuricea clavata]